jgi:hypothetical protein
MWKELGILGLLFGLALSGIYPLVVGEQTFNLGGLLMFAKVFILLIIIAWVIYVFIVAATQDKNKANDINKLLVIEK